MIIKQKIESVFKEKLLGCNYLLPTKEFPRANTVLLGSPDEIIEELVRIIEKHYENVEKWPNFHPLLAKHMDNHFFSDDQIGEVDEMLKKVEKHYKDKK